MEETILTLDRIGKYFDLYILVEEGCSVFLYFPPEVIHVWPKS